MCQVKNHTEASFKESNFSPLNGSSYASSLVSFDLTWLSFVPEIRSFDKHLNMNESDLRSDMHYLGSSENKAWKKFRPVRDY